MKRHSPSRREIAAALRYYEGLRPDGKPPPVYDDARAVAAQASGDTSKADDGKDTTPRNAARERFRRAKAAYTAAAKAGIAGEPFAVERLDDALAEFNAARAELARLGGER